MNYNLSNIDTKHTGLVLEGGAMRGVFTCGVLDWFMDNDIRFPYVVGVSAGACNGASYISNQRGRAKYSNIDLLEKYRYVGFKHYLKKGNLMDFDLLFNDFPNRILPFDFSTYADTQTCFEMVVSNCNTGQAEYKQEYQNHDRLLDILKASSSMPFFSPVTPVDGIPMLDGGVCDSIPAKRAIEKGFDKLVIVLTRNKNYRKKSNSTKIPPIFFRKYPKMLEAINNRNRLYNKQLEFVEKLEAEGRATVIRPIEPMTINRIEKNIDTLTHFYNHGYDCAARIFKES
ncbi:patatin family protein [Dysgonomonas sp. OttesenSCG-928-M03]|nr:patatin family protein [Dysgonomonas sp. OttesenSCG-928-M03]